MATLEELRKQFVIDDDAVVPESRSKIGDRVRLNRSYAEHGGVDEVIGATGTVTRYCKKQGEETARFIAVLVDGKQADNKIWHPSFWTKIERENNRG